MLGRVSNLPTVWSNCLAAWLLGGGGSSSGLLVVMLGASLVYLGGMWLNDAADAGFDREHRPERPIPAGRIAAADVWVGGIILLLGGAAVLVGGGRAHPILVFLLVLSVILYDLVHKRIPFASVVMGACRFLLFLVAGSSAVDGVTGEAVWSALVLAGYVTGLSEVARVESGVAPGSPVIRWWAVGAVLLPLGLAGFMNPPAFWVRPLLGVPAALFGLWTARCLVQLWRPDGSGPRRAVAGWLAGIVWVDVLAVLPAPWPWGCVFLACFGLAILLQRVIPAT